MSKYNVKVGITIGDPAGIGPLITLKAVKRLREFADFVVIGDEWVFKKNQSALGNKLRRIVHRNFSEGGQNLKFIDLNNVPRKNFEFGKIKAEYGRASIEYLDKAWELIKKKKIDCLVTCPVSKEAINLSGIKFSGHTEYMAQKSDTKDFVMMLLNKYLKISLVTRHIPLRYVASSLNDKEICKTIILTYKALISFFGIRGPRIVVCGLNPHASDNALLGEEENRIIKPIVKELKKKINYLDGPLPADVAISKIKQGSYDCGIAMYHDQALIALKLLSPNRGVNLTLGLPFIRTSPLHGTAFDIANNYSLADPASLIEAIKLAVRCQLNLRKV